jgi:predicted PurR-regulated permease PerM
MERTRLDGYQIFSWLLVGLALVLLWAVIRAFWSALFLAGVLAGVFSGLQRRLARRLGGRVNLAAGLLTVLVLLAIVLPFGGIAGVVTKELISVINSVRSAIQEFGLSGMMERLPAPLQSFAQHALENLTGGDQGQSWVSVVQSQSGRAAAAVTRLLSATTRAVIHALLMLVAFYFLLTDGERLVGWLERVAPLPPGRFQSFLTEFRGVTRAVVFSTVGTGAAQTLAAMLGLLIARVPNTLLWTLVTFFVYFIPGVGAWIVPVSLSIGLFVQGRTGWGIFLVVWGLLVVGLVDNVVRPLLIKGEVEMHGAVVFFALLGGLAAFGAVGLVAGPLVVAFFIAISRAYAEAPPRAG